MYKLSKWYIGRISNCSNVEIGIQRLRSILRLKTNCIIQYSEVCCTSIAPEVQRACMKRFLSRRTHKQKLDDALRGSVSRILQKTLFATQDAEQA